MATITTTTNANPLRYPMSSMITRNIINGNLYTLVKATGGEFEVWVSTNNGTSWAQAGSDLVRANVQEWSSLHADNQYYLNWAYRTNESSADRIYVRRFSVVTNSWGPELLLDQPGNGGSAGSVYNGLDVAAVYFVRGADQGYAGAVAVGTTYGGLTGCTVHGWWVGWDGTMYAGPTMFGSYRQWMETGSGRTTPSIELEWIGDGATSSVMNAWITWGRTNVRLIKCPFNGFAWVGPVNATLMGTVNAQEGISGRFDGTRFLIAVPNQASTSTVVVWERNKANTTTTTRVTQTHPTGVVRNCTVSYNSTNGDFRVYAIGTSNATLYYCDYNRGAGTFTAWTQYSATAILGTMGENYNVRRATYGNTKYDLYVAQSSGPSNLIHTGQSVSYAPLAPTWDYTGLLYRSGDPQDVSALGAIQWTFRDPDPTDTQGFYAMRRQIGAGAFEYLRSSDTTWIATETQNATSSSQRLFTGGTWAPSGGATATIQYWVKTWDASGAPGPYSDTALVIVPSVYVNPTITAPTAAQVISTPLVTLTWTVSEQTEFFVRLDTNPGGVPVYSSGWIVSASLRTFIIPYALSDGSGWTITFWTKNNEYLVSGPGGTTRSFTVQFIDPATPAVSFTLLPDSGKLRSTIANPTPAGTQPTVASNELWRRPSSSDLATINFNPDFEVNTTPWAASGSSTISRSTIQFKFGVASLRVVPNGVATTPAAEIAAPGNAVTPGAQYFGEAWVRPDTANKLIGLRLYWFTAASAFISSTEVNRQPVAATWMYLTVIGTAPNNAAFCSIGVQETGTPAVGDAFYADEIRLRSYNGDNGIRLITQLPNNGTYDDFQAVSLVPYSYRVNTIASNGTNSYGPWTP